METERARNIVIVGAGFGGLAAALRLARDRNIARAGYHVILLEKNRHHLYTPALYEIAAIPRELEPNHMLRSSVLIPMMDIVANTRLEMRHDEMIGVQMLERFVETRSGEHIPYDYLIFALGSETKYFGIPGLKEHSYPLKTFADAVRLRNAIENTVKEKEHLAVVVGGAGSTGVELVAEFINFVCTIKERVAPARQNVCNVTFTLLEAAEDILPGFDPWVIKKTRARLENLGIQILINTLIEAVEKGHIHVKGRATYPYDIFIWSGGVEGPLLAHTLGIPLSPKGSFLTDEYLHVQETQGRIYAVGDNATVINPHTGNPLGWNVPAAENEARHAADNIAAAIAGKPEKKFAPPPVYPFILAVGKKFAVADLRVIRFSGFLGWIAKQLVELRYLLSIIPFQKALRIWWRSVGVARAND